MDREHRRLWIPAPPFVLTGAIGAGTTPSSNVTVGIVALGLAGYEATGR